MIRLFCKLADDQTACRCYPSVLDTCELTCNNGAVEKKIRITVCHTTDSADLAITWRRTLHLWGYEDVAVVLMEEMPHYIL